MSTVTYGYGDREIEIPSEIDHFDVEIDKDAIVLRPDDATSGRRAYYINPGEWQRNDLFELHFGAYGDTLVLVWANSFEKALEEAAGWLSDNAPGIFTEISESDVAEARDDLAKQKGVDPSEISEEEAQEAATTDMTYTESGWIASWEWGGHEAGPEATAAALKISAMVDPPEGRSSTAEFAKRLLAVSS